MHNTTYILLGKELRTLASSVCEQVRKNAADAAEGFNAFSWYVGSDSRPDIVRFLPAAASDTSFAPDLSNQYQVEQVTIDNGPTDERQMGAFFMRHYQERITLGQDLAHRKMALCLVAAAHDPQGVDLAISLAHSISGVRSINVVVDVLLLAPDLTRLCNDNWDKAFDSDFASCNQAALNNAQRVCDAKEGNEAFGQVLLIQNTNADHVSLHFDIHSLALVLSWFAIAAMADDGCLHNPAMQPYQAGKVASFGLSVLQFDRYYYLHFLLRHAYIAIMEREGLQMREADVNKVANVAQRRLEGKANFFTSFYQQYVAARLNEGKTVEQVTPHIASDLKRFMADFEHEMMGFLKDSTLSLPEKRAVMAQILLSDDDLLTGSLFDSKQLTFLDLLKEPMGFFTKYNNEAMTFRESPGGKTEVDPDTQIPIIDHSVLSRPQGQDGYIEVPVDRLKQYRINIRQASEYIRKMDDDIRAAKQQQTAAVVSQQVVVADHFNFENSRFRSAQVAVEEHPLQEKFVADTPTTEKSVDLSADFTPVKNQDDLGACAVFAVTSVMEYILQKNKKLTSDLSERFAYYNVREKRGELGQQGAAISDVIEVIAEKGICTEVLCPYQTEHADDRPTDEAYQDAVKHRILKAESIDVGPDIQQNLDVLRTAIAEGYPVVVSLKVFKEMDLGLPFIAMPEEGDEGSNHAMVICGYDDEAGFFKVRNSWGTRFGSEGYCYMPYAYIAQAQYLNAAYIITEISSIDNVKGVSARHRISFDSTDSAIRLAILHSLKELKKVQQKQWIEEYRQVYSDYIHLNNVLRDHARRNDILEDAHDILREYRLQAIRGRDEKAQTLGPRIEEHKRQTRRNTFIIGLSAAVLILMAFVLSWVTESWGAVNLILLAFAGLTLAGMVGYFLDRRHDLASLTNRLEQALYQQGLLIGKLENEEKELDIKGFVAGMMLDSLSELYNKLSTFNVTAKSYVNNLFAWYEEEKQCVDRMTPALSPPFISLLDNDTLMAYYRRNEKTLIADISLSGLLEQGDYSIDEQSIIRFKNMLKDAILEKLKRSMDNFSVYNYLRNPALYPFIRKDDEQLQRLLRQAMTPFSKVLLATSNNAADAQVYILTKHPANLSVQLRQQCGPYCPSSPSCVNMEVKDSLIVLQTDFFALRNVSL